MNITAINGSPKGRNSNTEVMLSALLKGFGQNSNATRTIYLSEKKIGYCTGCYSCWTKTPGICVQKDDMATLIQEMSGSDIIIFGSPLYFNNISGTLKVFIDRLTAAGGDPHAQEKAKGKNPKYIMMSNCGFPVPQQFNVVSAWIRNFCLLAQTQVMAEFYTTNGKVLTVPTDEQKGPRKRYLDYLVECGRELSLHDALSAEQKEKAKKSILEF